MREPLERLAAGLKAGETARDYVEALYGFMEELKLETALTDIFAQDIREVTMEARDTTVHILKKFGAETTGAPFSFYRGTVTPMRLTREAFWNSHTGGQI